MGIDLPAMISTHLQYRQLGFLGRGGTAEAFLVEAIGRPKEPFVLKQIRADKKGQPGILASFEMEAKTLAKLEHPNIVKYLGGEPEQGRLFLEYVSGISADQLLRKEGRLPVQRAIPFILDLCAALDHAHNRGVIHGDLKPENLVILHPSTDKEYLKLVDFGFARIDSAPLLGIERLHNPNQVKVKGTPSYIAPEILLGLTVDGRADLYSIGVILFEFLAGRPPFTQSDLDELLEAHIRKDPPHFSAFNLWDIPDQVEEICRRCLSKYPTERYPTVRELGYTLADLAGIEWNPDPLRNAETQQVPSVVDASREGELCFAMDAWMPEPIAVMKLNGFLNETQCQLLRSEPGKIQAVYQMKRATGLFSRLMGRTQNDMILLEIRLNKPSLYQQVVEIRVKFTAQKWNSSLEEFEAVVEKLFLHMKSFMISRN